MAPVRQPIRLIRSRARPIPTDAVMLRALVTSLLFSALPAFAASFDCRVTGIANGDTFSCLDASGEHVRVKLAEIDTPELRQPYGSQARQALASYIFGKTVTLTAKGRDDAERTLARVGPVTVRSILNWSGLGMHGPTAATSMTGRFSIWRQSRASLGGACGRYPKRISCLRGNGASSNAAAVDTNRS